jgi:threonine dehydratase
MAVIPPSIPAIREAAAALEGLIVATPVIPWQPPWLADVLGATKVFLKLELFQHAGSFKPRGALTRMLGLDPGTLKRGVTAVSAGNHAAAVAFSAARLGVTAKVVMPASANPSRVALCRTYGAEIVFVKDVHEAFPMGETIERDEGRTMIHPFEGVEVSLGTATLGLELIEQVPDLDAIIVPIGGGGLASGVAAAVKQLSPECAVFGVEPTGADSMSRSFAAGSPQAAGAITTIADSLAPPFSLPHSFSLCRQLLDDLVLVDDDALCSSLYHLFRSAKLAVEPAGAASTAALLGPLRDRLRGSRVGLIVCGANIDHASFATYLTRGAAAVTASGV